MSGVSGFAKLVGIVVDTTGKYLKSYLVDLPRTTWRLIFDEVTHDRFIPWKRGEKWAKQLVKGVSQVHSKRPCDRDIIDVSSDTRSHR